MAIALWAWTAAGAAELQSRPAQLELIDGQKVSGQLAAETETLLVLYSPSGGAIHSFSRSLVHAITLDGQRKELGAKGGAATDAAKAISWNGWPDAPPETGPKPDYTTQKWDPPERLLVWAKPGKSGRIDEASNWLVFGEPLQKGGRVWDDQTDVVMPAADTPYVTTGGSDYPVTSRLNLTFRHLTIENGARIGTHDASAHGNVWLKENGSLGVRYSVHFLGPHHTFIRNDRPRLFKVGVNPHSLSEKTLSGYYISQYISPQKDKDASVEFVGHFLSNDKFFIFSGTCIIGPHSAVMSSNRSPDRVFPGATLQVMSGAIWGKHNNHACGESYDINGTAMIGSTQRPITEDAYIAMPFKDYSGVMAGYRDVTVSKNTSGDHKGDVFGFHVTSKGRFRVHSADPAKARAVFCFHGRETSAGDAGFNVHPSELGRRADLYEKLPRQIDLVLLGDVELNGVLFEDVHKGGIRLKDMAMKDKFQNVFWGRNCGGKPEEMFAVFKPNTPPQGWVEEMGYLLGDQ
jgi:hypothetical protein